MSSPGRFLRGPVAPEGAHVAVGGLLAGVVLSEGLVALGRTRLALVGHVCTLLACTAGPLLLREEVGLFQAFALLPVFRLVSLGMPVFVELTVYWFPLVYGPFLPAVLVVARHTDAVELTTGWRPAVATLPFVVVAGAVLGELEYAIIRPEALVPAATPAQLVVLTVVMVVFVGLVEELLFRGLLQGTLRSRFGRWPAVVVAAGVFAAMHAGYGLLAEVGFAFALGLLLGALYEWTDSLATVTLLHGVLNTFLFGVVPAYGPLLAVG